MKMIDLSKLLKTNGLQQVDLARKLKLNRSSVHRWARGRIPAERVFDVEKVTGIPREKLRPDLFARK
jgi:DNA-binding transcriptional regulator YdaS (Cro superfamily)